MRKQKKTAKNKVRRVAKKVPKVTETVTKVNSKVPKVAETVSKVTFPLPKVSDLYLAVASAVPAVGKNEEVKQGVSEFKKGKKTSFNNIVV